MLVKSRSIWECWFSRQQIRLSEFKWEINFYLSGGSLELVVAYQNQMNARLLNADFQGRQAAYLCLNQKSIFTCLLAEILKCFSLVQMVSVEIQINTRILNADFQGRQAFSVLKTYAIHSTHYQIFGLVPDDAKLDEYLH